MRVSNWIAAQSSCMEFTSFNVPPCLLPKTTDELLFRNLYHFIYDIQKTSVHRSALWTIIYEIWMNCFCGMVEQLKAFTPYFQPGPSSEILTIANLRHAGSKVWTCAESEFRLCWMKLCSSDNHYTMSTVYH